MSASSHHILSYLAGYWEGTLACPLRRYTNRECTLRRHLVLYPKPLLTRYRCYQSCPTGLHWTLTLGERVVCNMSSTRDVQSFAVRVEPAVPDRVLIRSTV